jgi:hypothetical protein
MVLHMVTSYGPQATQVNEKSTPESSLDLTLTQHPCDKDPEPQKVCVLILKSIPLELSTIAFLQIFAPW